MHFFSLEYLDKCLKKKCYYYLYGPKVRNTNLNNYKSSNKNNYILITRSNKNKLSNGSYSYTVI